MINKIAPIDGKSLFKYHYINVNLEIQFTGKIVIATDFINEMYVHMGFQSPTSFKKVIELHITEGDIIKKVDLSSKMEEIRNIDPDKVDYPPSDSQKDIQK